MRTTAFLLALLLLVPPSLEAQTERRTGFAVQQFSMCPQPNMAEVNRLMERVTPILSALQEEGLIRAWYDMRHGWGDEWNVVLFTVADSRDAWFTFWDEAVRRMNAAEPGLIARFGELCPQHKDNIYSIRDRRAGS